MGVISSVSAHKLSMQRMFQAVLLALTVLCVANAAELSSEELSVKLAEARAENERLQASMAEKDGEVQRLRAKLGITQENDNELNLQDLIGEEDLMDDEEWPAEEDEIDEGVEANDAKKCPGRCNKDCGIPNKGKYGVDAGCKLTQANFGHINKKIKFVGTKAHPKWKVPFWGFTKTFECPCHTSKGRALHPDEALRLILGQLWAVGVPKKYAENVAKGKSRGSGLVARMGYAVTKMFTCWKSKCSGKVSGLELLQDFWGGGASC